MAGNRVCKFSEPSNCLANPNHLLLLLLPLLAGLAKALVVAQVLYRSVLVTEKSSKAFNST